jgi:hypothetical protein
MMKRLSVFILCTFFISNQASQIELIPRTPVYTFFISNQASEIPLTPRTRDCLQQAFELAQQRLLEAPWHYSNPIRRVRGEFRQDLSQPLRQGFAIIEQTGEPCAFFHYTDQLGQSVKLCVLSNSLQECFASHPNPDRFQQLAQQVKDQLVVKPKLEQK